jgi:hypothetical protein
MSVIAFAAFDYKYGDADWRADPAEDFRVTKKVRTVYTTDGDQHLIKTVAETTSWASAIARIADNIVTGPPYWYADKDFHADVHEQFQLTRRVTTTYEAFSDTSYQVTIHDLDVLTGIDKVSHQIIDGKIPLAPVIKSALTSTIYRPLVAQLEDKCEFVDNTQPLDLPYAENESEMQRAATRQEQRDRAILREFSAPMDPTLEIGMTIRLIHPSRSIDALHILTTRKATIDPENGGAKDDLGLEFWQR